MITEQKNISNDRDELEKKADFNIVGQNAIMQSANMARAGNTRFAQAYAKNWGRKMKVNAVSEEQQEVRGQYMDNFKHVYDVIGKHDQKEQIA